MTAARLGTLSVLLGGAAIVTVLTVTGGVVLARLWFLARIEAIRGDVVDAVLDGFVRPEPAAAWLAVLDHMAGFARRARAVSPARAWPSLPASGNPGQLCPGDDQLTTAEQYLVTSLAARARAAARAHLTWDRPAGFLTRDTGPRSGITARARHPVTLESERPVTAREPAGTDSLERRRSGQWLRDQRQARGWNVPDMRRELRNAVDATGDELPGDHALSAMIFRWENNRSGVTNGTSCTTAGRSASRPPASATRKPRPCRTPLPRPGRQGRA